MRIAESVLRVMAIALAALVAASHADGVGIDIKPLWSIDLQTFLESAPTLADLNGDARCEILAAGREEMIAVDGAGKELWRWRTPGRYMTYPAVLERAGQSPLIYAADTCGAFTCLDAQGKPVWQAKLAAGSTWSAAVVCDLASDGAPDVVQTDESGAVWAFCALTGTVRWRAAIKGMPVSPAVGDIDGDGKPEVAVCTTKGVLALLGGDGEVRWEKTLGGVSETWGTSAPIIVSAADGLRRVIAASSDGVVRSYDQAGHELWRRDARGPVASSLSAGDLDGDGHADIFAITQLGVVFRYDEDGAVLWDIDMQGRGLAGGALADVDGDSRLEFALCTQAGRLIVLDEKGETRFEHQFDSRTINVTPAVGDVNDAAGLEMAITGGESGRLFCFALSAPVDARRVWGQYRGNAQMTGALLGGAAARVTAAMAPRGLAPSRILTGQPVVFNIENPERRTLTARATCIRPDGARQTAMTRVLGPRGVLNMPVDAPVAGVYHFSWQLADTSGEQAVSGERDIFVQPFANDQAVAAHALARLRVAAFDVRPVLPLSAAALDREAAVLASDIAAVALLQAAAVAVGVEEGQDALRKTAAVTARAMRAVEVAEAVRQAAQAVRQAAHGHAAQLGGGASLIAFEGDTWESRGVDALVPRAATNPLKLARRRVVPGEHDAVSVEIFNVTDRELQVRVMTEGAVTALHRVIGTVTARGGTAWDALPALDESAVVSVPSLETREVWIDTDWTGAAAGEQLVKVRLQALNGAGVVDAATSPQDVLAPEVVVEVPYAVQGFAMAPPDSFRLCTWASIKGPWDTDPLIADLLEHGNNVFLAPLPAPVYENGKLARFDYAALDPILTRLKGTGSFLLLSGMPAFQSKLGSPEYAADLKQMLQELVTRLGATGFEKSQFAMYPIDEAGGLGWEAVNRVIDFAKAVKAADGTVQVYVNGGGELPMYEAMAPYVDIWCPGHYQLPDGSPAAEFVRKGGKTVWTYNCAYMYSHPTGPNIKDINVVAEFRLAALFGLRYGATGIGYWCYNSGGDMWQRVAFEYPLVYTGQTRPVTSRRWEAVREGIEDCRIALALKARLDDAALNDNARARIRRLIDVSLPEMIDLSFAEMNQGLGRDAIDLSNNGGTVAAFREELMDCVQSLAE